MNYCCCLFNNSNRLDKLINSFLSFLILFEKTPLIWLIAILCELSEFDEIRADTASACDKSIFPFIKERNVNSPLSAILAPNFTVIERIFLIIKSDPWQDISIIFSLVYELGFLNTEINTSSIIDFSYWN